MGHDLLVFFQKYSWGCGPKKLRKTRNKEFLIIDRRCTPGTAAYLIKPPAAKKLVAEALPITLPTDEYINEKFFVKKTLKVYATFPETIKTNDVNENSIIQDMGGR